LEQVELQEVRKVEQVQQIKDLIQFFLQLPLMVEVVEVLVQEAHLTQSVVQVLLEEELVMVQELLLEEQVIHHPLVLLKVVMVEINQVIFLELVEVDLHKLVKMHNQVMEVVMVETVEDFQQVLVQMVFLVVLLDITLAVVAVEADHLRMVLLDQVEKVAVVLEYKQVQVMQELLILVAEQVVHREVV
jgi:hypothetical protein